MPKLGDLIEGEAATVERHEPLAMAAKRMYESHIGSVCVEDESGELVGIFTERDLLRAAAAGVDSHASTVGNWMTEDPITATADDEAGAALQVMIDRNFRHLPVMGDAGLLGVVSMRRLSAVLQSERMG
ncbi:MAG TPA: CBS domain-containing protein [Nitriliruptorales bacterium]